MRSANRTRRIPSYVTTQEQIVEKDYKSTNMIVMGLLIASVVLAFVSSTLTIVNLFCLKKKNGCCSGE